MSSFRFINQSSETDPLNTIPNEKPFPESLNPSYDRRILQLGYLNKRKIWLFDTFSRMDARIVSNNFELDFDFESNVNPDEKLITDIQSFLKLVFNETDEDCNLRCELGSTHNKEIDYYIDNNLVSRNLTNLSTGQNTILDIFLGILMDHSKIVPRQLFFWGSDN